MKKQEQTNLPLEADKLIMLYRRMVAIRRFEETVFEVYRRGWMPGLAHLSDGQEATPVGICAALNPDDTITSTHRGHGHIIAKGGELGPMMAEVMGKESGYCRGKGGEMHIADVRLGILGANGIVGGGIGIAAGAAFSFKRLGKGQVSVAFFGDGAVNQGIWYETANLAVLWQLPLIYVCENNQYTQFTHWSKLVSGEGLAARARAMGMEAWEVDGNDVLAVYETAQKAVARARAGLGPSTIICHTIRYGGHHVGDPGTGYRSKEEMAAWREKDCIVQFEQKLLQMKVIDPNTLETIREELETEIENAVTQAREAPTPDVSEVTEDVYA